MLTRRNRDLLPQKTGPTPFAAKAKDLGALHEAVVDAASVGAGLWVSYLFALFYFAIAAGAVTHRDLLLESPVKLPFLNVELPLKAFFILGPLVFLILHAYVLLHFVLLAGRIGAFHLELETQIGGDDAQTRLRRQLPSNIFVQSFAGPREVRTGIIGFLLRRIIEISLVVGPIALLVLFQLQFLPYHSEWITSWQRTAVVIDLVLLWILWPRIARGESAGLVWVDFKRVKVQAWLLASFLPVLVMVTIATFPGESLEQTLRPVPGWATLHKLLVAGEVNYVTGMPQSPWSKRSGLAEVRHWRSRKVRCRSQDRDLFRCTIAARPFARRGRAGVRTFAEGRFQWRFSRGRGFHWGRPSRGELRVRLDPARDFGIACVSATVADR